MVVYHQLCQTLSDFRGDQLVVRAILKKARRGEFQVIYLAGACLDLISQTLDKKARGCEII